MPATNIPDERARLDAIVDVLDAAGDNDGFGFKSMLVHVIDLHDEEGSFNLAFHDLHGWKATDALLGFRAPAEWWVLGSVSGGWAAPADDAIDRPSAPPQAVRARTIALVARSGVVATRTTTADGQRIDEVPTGPGIDVLHRALGLATPPPEHTVSELLTGLWLESIVRTGNDARREGRRLTWPQVARLHPALWLLAQGGHRARPDELVTCAAALTNVLDWSEVRRQCAERAWLAGLVEPEDAAWMDEGMLARWLVLAHLAPIGLAVRRARKVLRREVATHLDDALRGLGVELDAAA
jgi:hypothetical protein